MNCFEKYLPILKELGIEREDKLSRVEDVCKKLDVFAEEHGGTDFSIFTDTERMSVILGIDFPVLILHHRDSDIFFDILKIVDAFSFDRGKEEMMRVNFHIDDMLEPVVRE